MESILKQKSFPFAIRIVDLWIALLLALVTLLGLTACATEPEATVPEVSYDLVYDMNNYSWFSEIFDEKAADQWDAMGRYTILLERLHTPVIVEMDGRIVLSVSAYGYTQAVTIGEFQDEVNAQIQSLEAAVLVNENCDYDGSTWILTADGCYAFHPEGDISTQIYADGDSAMRYSRYWGEYYTTFNQDDYAPLYSCTGRSHFLYEKGTAEIVNGEVILTAEITVTVSDEYDLDAMFAQAKAEGMFEEYDSVDELLIANQARGK